MSDDPKKILLAQARTLGLEVDGRWSTDTLAEKVQEAQEASASDRANSIRKASDTSVTLLKDAWPVDDERHLAGETIKVPAEMAKRWYKVGVAIPSDD